MSKRSPPKSRTSLWRDKKARSSELVCQCEYHQEADIGDSSVCQCEYHGSHRNKVSDCCGCEYHSPIDQCQSDYCGCEYHSPVDQCQSDSTSSDSEPSQQSISPNENDVNDRDNRSTSKAPSSCSLLPSESRSHHNADVLNSIPSASKSNLNDNKNGMQHEISVHTLGDVPGDESNSYCEENVGSTTDTTVIANKSTNKAPSSCSLLPSESRSHYNADVLNSIPSASKSNLNDNKNGMQHEISVHTLGDVPGDESNSYCEENVGSTTDTTVIANKSTNKAPSSCSLLPSESRSHYNADVLNSIPSASKSNLNDNNNGMQHEVSVHTLGDVPGDESNSYCEENVGSTTDTTVIANKSTNKAPSSCSLLPSESRSHDYADVSNSSASAFGGVSNYDNNKMQPEIHVDESAGVTAGKNLQQHSVSSSSPDNSPRSSPSYFSEDIGKGLQVHALGENPGDGSNSDREENLHWWQEDSNSEGSSQDGSSSDEPPSSGPELGDSDDSNDPDDPDDPEDGGEEDGSDSSESDPDADMQEGAQNFSLQNERLDLILDLAAGRTTREVVAMVMALAVRSSLDYETVVKIFNILHVMLVGSNLPTTKDQMWSILNRNAAGIRKHVYCSQCVKLLGLLQQLPNPVVCECGWTKAKNKVKYFITLNVRSQLEHILKLPGMWQKLQYPQYRRKRSDEAYEDIIDGDAYKRLRQAEGLSHYDFSFIFNLDGLKAFKKGKCEAWPIFMKLNELPPNLRQKHMILAGVWLDQEHVDFNLFMKTFVKQANKLSGQGLTWKPDGVHEQVSRFFPSCCAADAKARAGILCMAQHVGTYGCTFCEHKGIKLEGSMKYPIPGTIVNRLRRHRGVEYFEQVEIQQGLIRTDESIKNLMQQVVEDPQMRRIRGVTGPAQVMLMSFFDLGNGFSTDDLHPIFLGVAQFHTEILFEGVEDVYRVGKNEKAIITRRLLKSLTPTHISRKPCSIEQMATWKGSEWRNWLLFYAIPCLQGIIPERYLRVLALLTNGIFLLSRDVIEEANLLEAERCINQYLVQFQELYGPQNMRFNIHILSHLVQCVRSWGPLFCHGTMPFESWNHRIGKTVSSPKGAIDQVVMRFLMHALVDNIPQNPDISEEVKEIIDKKILKSPFQNVREVDGAYFFGRSTARNVTERERQALEEYDVENLTEYHQVKVSGMELRCVYYGAELKSNNTFIYSNDDDFGVVEGIVVLEGDNPVGGLFVQLYQTGNPLLGVSHIVPIIHDNDGLVFIQVGNIRNLAVKMNVLDQWYISPMPNQHEID